MKRLLVLALAILILTAAPAFAVLRILPQDVQDRLHGLALADHPGYQVSESWVQDFAATGREVFNIILIKGDEKVTVHVDVAAEAILSQEEMDGIIQAETEAQADNPIFTILSGNDLQHPELDSAQEDGGKNLTGLWIAAGGFLAFALAGGTVLYLKKGKRA